jgi:glucose dehydrogenase
MYGGAVVTDGGVVFYGDIQGYLNALDAETGDSLWRDRAAKGYVGPPIAFQLDGHDRIAITSRDGLVMYGLRGER